MTRPKIICGETMKSVKRMFIIWGLVCLAACGRDKSPTRPRMEPPALPLMESIEINLPAAAPAQVQNFSSDIYRPLAGIYRTYENIMKDVQPRGSYPIWTWTLSTPLGLVIVVEAEAVARDSIMWALAQQSTFSNNWIYAKGKITADANYGVWKFYKTNSVVVSSSIVWRRNVQRVLTIEETHFYDPNPLDDVPESNIHSTLVGQPDKSGDMKAFNHEIKIFEAKWDTAGTGSWASYNFYTGQQTESGTWR